LDETAMLPGLRTALYLRVSTADQKPDLQYDGLRGYAERSGLVIVGDYCDVAVSGRYEGRPQLTALMTAARRREFDGVLVWKFDRFARSTRHLLMALDEFRHLGIRFISVQDQVDTASPIGLAMFTIIGAMAELESALISERVTVGMKAAKARGKHLGRPPIRRAVVTEIEALAASTDLSIRRIHEKIQGKASCGIVGEITKRIRSERQTAL
jgi:DNA invertase Pin-like site-specific DNA recombinase